MEFHANEGKNVEIEVNGEVYLRHAIKTRFVKQGIVYPYSIFFSILKIVLLYILLFDIRYLFGQYQLMFQLLTF